MKRFVRFGAGLAIGAGIITLGGEGHAIAQLVRTAPVRNQDEPGRNPYFDDFRSSTFSGTTCPSGANTNSSSGQCFDVLLDAGVLVPGTYQIAISAFENMSFAENSGGGKLAAGFTGLGNLAFGEDLHYAFDVHLTPFARGAGAFIQLVSRPWPRWQWSEFSK
jgi:hypothetical protein